MSLEDLSGSMRVFCGSFRHCACVLFKVLCGIPMGLFCHAQFLHGTDVKRMNIPTECVLLGEIVDAAFTSRIVKVFWFEAKMR